MIRRAFESLFPVRSGEGRLTGLLFIHSLCAVGAFVAGRSVRDALFLAHAGREALAWMYVASAASVALVGLVYNPLAVRFRRDTLATWSGLVFSALFVAAYWLEQTARSWVYSAIYVYVEVMGAITLVQFWTLANELFNAREAKRLYGLIGSGGTLSNILVGLATGKIATLFGAHDILLLCAFLLLGVTVTSYLGGKIGRQRLFARAASGRTSAAKRSGGAARVLSSPHLRAVALLAIVTFFVVNLVDFEFKVIASNTYPANQLAAYFGYFYAVVGVLALGMQLFGTSRLLASAGVIGSLLVLPASLVIGNAALVMAPVVWAASLAKGADTLFRYSINDATTQILYLPVAPQARAPAKAFIDGVVKPVSIGLAGLMLVGYRNWIGADPHWLAWVSLALGVVWCGLVVSMRSHYVESLQENLRARRLDVDTVRRTVQDSSTQAALIHALGSNQPREILSALELLHHLEDVEMDGRVEPLLEHADPDIRMAALAYYARRQTMRFANSVFRRFEDGEPRVRAAAIDAFCTIGKDKAVKSVKMFVSDADPDVRSAAIIGLIRYGGLDGVLMAAEALKSLIAHPDPTMRQHAARVLGAIGVRNFYQPVLELMSDSDTSVRREAIVAAGKLRSPEFVLPLIYKTPAPETGREAIEALAAYGDSIAPTLAKVLATRVEDPNIRRGVARVLGRIATSEATQVITRHLDEPDEELRTRLYRSLARATRGRRQLTFDRDQLLAALDRELRRAGAALAASATLGLGPGPGPSTPKSGPQAGEALLSAALSEKIDQTEQRVFLLLAILYPDAGMEHIYAGIRDAAPGEAIRKRANAVELLDNLLPRSLKRALLPLLEDGPRDQRLRAFLEAIPLPVQSRDQTIVTLCQDETAWVRACAIFYAAQVKCEAAVDAIVGAVRDVNPVVREISLLSGVTAAPERIAPLAEAHLHDESTSVRERAALIARRA